MKKIITTFFIFLQVAVFSCPVCERQQPKIVRGIVHGAGPDSNWDYVIVWLIAIVAMVTFFFSIKWLLKPGEKNKSHIKYFILNNDYNER